MFRFTKALTLTALAALALPGCVASRYQIADALTRYGLNRNQASCASEFLRGHLSTGQVDRLARAARDYRSDGPMTFGDLVRVTASLRPEFRAELRELAEQSSGQKDATGDAHIFAIMDKMNKAALDLELLDKAHAGASSPKYAELAKQCVAGSKDGGQIVFCEYIDSHDKIVAALVDSGFKRDEIGVINAQVAGSAVKRQNIAEQNARNRHNVIEIKKVPFRTGV